jgi:hypothetical protein
MGEWDNRCPSAAQFGILGLPDAQGYYTITAIPYSGSEKFSHYAFVWAASV